jgi:hypothetical protein
MLGLSGIVANTQRASRSSPWLLRALRQNGALMRQYLRCNIMFA